MDDRGTTEPDGPTPPRSHSRRWLCTSLRLSGLIARSIGVLATVLLVNFALGWAWDAAVGGPGRGAQPARPDPIRFASSGATRTSPIVPPPDPRAKGAAMRPYPWSAAYFRDLASAPVGYWPYAGLHDDDFASRYVNQRAGLRRSYEPPATAGRVPTVSFYGGSTMWGEGQRDLHTIPSEVARLAARDGLPVRVANHGIRGISSWDEALLFEADVAAGDEPDLAVFYDGLNDCNLQAEAPDPGQPWEYLVDDMRARLGADSRPRLVPTAHALQEVWAQYARHSLVHKLVGGVGHLLAAAPAGAETPAATGRGCAAVYRRARASILDIAGHAGLAARFFWQPVKDRDGSGSPFRSADPLVGPPTIDVTHALDSPGPPVYLDGGHTNERGAQLVARAIWAHLRPVIAARYRTGG